MPRALAQSPEPFYKPGVGPVRSLHLYKTNITKIGNAFQIDTLYRRMAT